MSPLCSNCNCNCNWGTCIVPPTRRPRTHHRVNPYPGARRVNETEMFSDHDETSPSNSIAAVLTPSAARCSMLAMQQLNRKGSVANSSTCPRHDEVASCHTMKRAVWIDLEYWQPMTQGLRYNQQTKCKRAIYNAEWERCMAALYWWCE